VPLVPSAPPGSPPVIEAHGLGIRFSRNRKRRLSVREVLLRGRNSSPRGSFWALRDVSFSIAAGEAVGLVGGNGSGKSTLLRMVAGVMLPDEGEVTVRDGVAPLIELTGGFVDDLTARDNIWLAAGLHGLSRAQVEERFEDIVDFAGQQVRDALDTPFRHFSNGMKVRLGFSVITTLDEPIILVDEILAVGDKKFREQCTQRMEDLVAGGRTLFLVSHNENDLRRFCSRGLWLRDGRLEADGPLADVLKEFDEDDGERAAS
jgi:ABC-2 type transport system ATP-binding protein